MIKSFFYCFLVSAVLLSLAALFTKSIWSVYLDKTPPQISLLNPGAKIGVGSEGGKIGIKISDTNPGLDEVVVRLRQLRSDHELFRKKLGGIKETELNINVSGQHGMVGEGPGEVEIVAFDRSFYNNRGSIVAKAFVDTRQPHLEVISAQHNLRQGGSQLVIYSAKDENLAFSGVRVGSNLFKGFPAGQLDSSLNKPGLYAALYTVPMEFGATAKPVKPDDVKLRVVDIGGNAVEQTFYNRIARRVPRVINTSNARLISWLASFPADNAVPAEEAESADIPSGSDLGDKAASKKGAAIDAATLVQAFDRVPGTVVQSYADRINLPQRSGLETGKLFIFMGLSEARALHSGEITSIKNLDSSMIEITIDHGLGLSSTYKGLKNIAVREGQLVKSGDLLGAVDSFLAVGASVSGIAVDLTEWWSQDWISAHIFEKIQEVKKSLGIVVE